MTDCDRFRPICQARDTDLSKVRVRCSSPLLYCNPRVSIVARPTPTRQARHLQSLNTRDALFFPKGLIGYWSPAILSRLQSSVRRNKVCHQSESSTAEAIPCSAEAVVPASPLSESDVLDILAALTPLLYDDLAVLGYQLVPRRLVLMDARAHQCLDGFALVLHHYRGHGNALLAPATTVVYQAAHNLNTAALAPHQTRLIELKEELN
jgi:hypothetical protein